MGGSFVYEGANIDQVASDYSQFMTSSTCLVDLSCDRTPTDISLSHRKNGLPFLEAAHFVSSMEMKVRRSSQHIRMDGTRLYFVYLVVKGRLTISRADGRRITGPGHCAIFDTGTAYVGEAQVGDDGTHEAYIMLLQVDTLLRHHPALGPCNLTVDVNYGTGALIGSHLKLIYDHGPALPLNQLTPLTRQFVGAVADYIASAEGCLVSRKSLAKVRIDEIREYISNNLTNSDLSVGSVAAGCGISPRYVCRLLRNEGQTFSSMLWELRLERASHYLLSIQLRCRLIREIALMLGFKSSAHFCRVFRQKYDCSPGSYRKRHFGSKITLIH